MARRNSADQCRGRGSCVQGGTPAPLYDRVEDLGEAARSGPDHALAQSRAAARAALERAETHVIHNPIPQPARCCGPDRTAELLCRQNELLTEILGVLNAQLAVGLGQRPPS